MRTATLSALVVCLGLIPSTARSASIITGLGAGGSSEVSVFDATGARVESFFAYDPNFAGGVRVAVGDVTGDGVPDIVTGAGPGGAPTVKVFDGATGAMIRSFFAFDVAFSGGIYVAVGNVNGDKMADIIVGADAGGGPHVKVFDGATGAVLFSFFAYDVAFTGGVRVAAGDVNGDGVADIITGAGPGGAPHVKVFDGTTGAEIQSFFAFDPVFNGGVFVAAGDVNNDGIADLVVGADAGGAPHVSVFDGATNVLLQSFFAYDVSFSGGVRVAAGDVNGDGIADIVTAAGSGGSPDVKVFDGKTGVLIRSFLAAAPTFAGGVYVAASSGSISPSTTLSTLIADVRTAFPESTNLLESAQARLEAGDTIPVCNKIGAFILQVTAQSGKRLATQQADDWIAIASDLRVALSCR